MTERYHRSSVVSDSYMNPTKMENDFTPKKTMIIMVIVVACFAVLWPKIFYPMLVGSANQQIKPSAIDKTTGCCYVLSETDVDTIKIMSELCGEIIRQQVGVTAPLTGRQIINICQDEVYRTCGIDVSMVLQEQVRLGHTTKQILDEIRSLNGSLCLKYNFGVQPWRLGVPHMVTLRNVSDSVRQERSPLVRSEMIHPAFRERGRAIPQAKPTRPHPKIIDGTPGPLPGMRPTMGGPGHMVPPSKQQGSGSMGIIMPIYTIGIVIFFTYTLMKIICKKHPETDTIYSKMDLDPRFRKEMLTENGSRGSRDAGSCKLGWKERDTRDVELDQLRRRLQETELAMERVVAQMAKVPLKLQEECLNSANLSNGSVKKDEKPSVKIMAMETSESCEDGKKWQSANSSVLPSVPQPVIEKVDPPKEIYLDRTLPAQSQILVADSATETEKNASNDDTAVVLAGKMTLSLISLENELEVGDILNVQSNETKEAIEDNKPILEEEINHIIEEAIECIDSSSAKTEIVPKQEVEMASYKTVANDINIVEKDEPEELILEIIEKETEETKKEEKSVPKKEQEVKIESGENVDSLESKRTEAAPDLVEKHRTTSEVPSSRTGKPLLNTNAKSSSEDSGSSILSGSNQGSVINVRTRSFEDDDKEEEEEEISEEESDVEYEEEEIEVSEEEENGGLEVQRERHSIQPGEIQNQNGGAELLNGVLTHNADPEGEESEEEEVIEEIIEEYSDDEENLELNSN
ncbi:VID27-like protein isoform X2 [Coccinella septempunctata]|uniref:VID27-like protein isoform X2 n=1 Tax=Coccinella septempunctata TaxID=41139 RepID=UPI001D08363F|nr:VID27-like protein isoform X2 [Coccinella septempunctata]